MSEKTEWVMVSRELLSELRDIAMEWAVKGRVPECGKFGEIAQDLDAMLAAEGLFRLPPQPAEQAAWYAGLDAGREQARNQPPSAPVGVEGFEQWYARVDARFWNNWDACNAAFHAGKRAALAQQPAPVAPVGVDAIRIADDLESWVNDPFVTLTPMRKMDVEDFVRRIRALAQQPAAGDGCHCGTCTCDPNMTPAVRFDLSPAQQEGAIREHLIRLGWTPPEGGASCSQLDAAIDAARGKDNE